MYKFSSVEQHHYIKFTSVSVIKQILKSAKLLEQIRDSVITNRWKCTIFSGFVGCAVTCEQFA